MIDYISCTEDGSEIRLYDEHEMRPVCESNNVAELVNAYLVWHCPSSDRVIRLVRCSVRSRS